MGLSYNVFPLFPPPIPPLYLFNIIAYCGQNNMGFNMAFLDFLRRETKASGTGGVIFTGNYQPVWSPRDYAAFAKEGYQQNVVAYQSINRIAEAVASVEWEAWQGETLLSTSPILDLINRPSQMQSRGEFMRAHTSYQLIAGNAYLEKIEINSVPKELYSLRPDRMSIVEGASGFPSKYIYKVGQRKIEWDVDQLTGLSDIWHFKSFNPVGDWYGQSATEAGAYAIDQHNEAMKWMQALLQNSARPSGALVVPKESTLTDDGYKRLKTQIEDQYGGASNAGRPMLLEGGMDWKTMGLSPSDMALIETKYSAARDIALAFGVPPQLLGIPGDNTYANYQEARLAFWEDTVIPIVDNTADELNAFLSESFGGVELRPNLDLIPAIVDKRKSLWEMADKSTDLTVDERRELKGYPPMTDGTGGERDKPMARQQGQTDDDIIKSLSPQLQSAFAYGLGGEE